MVAATAKKVTPPQTIVAFAAQRRFTSSRMLRMNSTKRDRAQGARVASSKVATRRMVPVTSSAMCCTLAGTLPPSSLRWISSRATVIAVATAR